MVNVGIIYQSHGSYGMGHKIDLRCLFNKRIMDLKPRGTVSSTWMSRVMPGTPKDMGPPYGKRDPYYSHTIPISLGSLVGIVWARGPITGVPEIPLRMWSEFQGSAISQTLEASIQTPGFHESAWPWQNLVRKDIAPIFPTPEMITLPETNSSPLKIGHPKRKL